MTKAAVPTSLDDECFYIAPIGADGSPERARSDGVFEFIVQRASAELGLTAIRADHISEPGQITIQVIDHVLGAKAAVVDLTGLNANVFYELAVRHTARMPVALIADKSCKLPFDIAQMRTIFFDHTDLRSADHCRVAIVAQLSEALTNGAVDSPIATSVDVKSLQNGSIVERNVAELVTSVEELASMQRRILIEMERKSVPSANKGALRELYVRHLQLEEVLDRIGDAELRELVTDLRKPVMYLTREVEIRGLRRSRDFSSPRDLDLGVEIAPESSDES